MVELKRLLVATDFSDASAQALEYAVELARETGAELDVVHVLDRPALLHAVDPIGGATPNLDFDGLAAKLDERVRGAASDAQDQGVTVNAHLLDGHPAHELVRFAEDRSSDLMVIGATGKGAIRRALLGSVADRVLRTSGCPVLILGPETRKSES